MDLYYCRRSIPNGSDAGPGKRRQSGKMEFDLAVFPCTTSLDFMPVKQFRSTKFAPGKHTTNL